MDALVHALALNLREALVVWLVLIALAVFACTLVAAPSWYGRLRRLRRAVLAGRDRVRRARRTHSTDRRYHTRQYTADPQYDTASGRDGASGQGGASGREHTSRRDTADRRDGASRPEHAARRKNADPWGDTQVLEKIDAPHRTEEDDALRYAEEVTVAAQRAADAAERWKSEWLAVQRARDAAWHAYEVAHEAARRAYQAAAFPVPESEPTPDEHAARERYLHRAAWEAYRRGDLSMQQLCDALAHRAGWDADRHPFEQEVILRRAGLERKLHAYQTVAEMERSAWRTADLAQSATTSLRAEARAASVRAGGTALAA